MRSTKLWRALATASAVAMMATSMPVMAEEAVDTAAEAVAVQEVADELVESGIIDEKAPEIKDAYFGLDKKHTINVKPGENITFFGEGLDDLSGVSSIQGTFRLKSETDYESIYLYASSNYYNDENGKSIKIEQIGLKADNETLRSDIKEGTYEIESFYLRDYAGNTRDYYRNGGENEIPEALKDLKIIVGAGAASVEEVLPTVKTLDLDKTVVKPGDVLNATITLSGELNNTNSVEAHFKTEDGTMRTIYTYKNDAGIYEGSITIGEYDYSADYKVAYIELYTGTRWVRYYDSDEYKEESMYVGTLPAEIAAKKFTIKDTLVDKEAPILEDMKLASDTVNVPGSVVITPVVREEGSGINYFSVYMQDQAQAETNSYTSMSSSYTAATGTLALSINQYQKDSKLIFYRLDVHDNAGNVSRYYRDYDKKSDSWKENNKDSHAMPEAIKALVVTVLNDDQAEDGTAKAVTTSTIVDSLVADIQSAADNSEIHVDISGNSVLKKEAIAAIKGTGKTLLLNSNEYQWVLKGSDVKNADADWNMAVSLYSTSSSAVKTALNRTGYISEMYFASQDLPGKVTLRIIPASHWRQYYGDATKDLYVYRVANGAASRVDGPLEMSATRNLEMTFETIPAKELYLVAGKVNVKTPYSDVDDEAWYADSVAYVNSNGIMTGIKGTTQFQPEATCTREMMITILYRVYGEPSIAGMAAPAFTDCDFTRWYGDAIVWGYNVGLTSGIKDASGKATTYGVGQPVTRQELATFLNRFAAIKGFDISARADITKFPDVNEVSGFAKEAISWANANSIITGKKIDGQTWLSPTAGATRAEVAKMIMNFQTTFGK